MNVSHFRLLRLLCSTKMSFFSWFFLECSILFKRSDDFTISENNWTFLISIRIALCLFRVSLWIALAVFWPYLVAPDRSEVISGRLWSIVAASLRGCLATIGHPPPPSSLDCCCRIGATCGDIHRKFGAPLRVHGAPPFLLKFPRPLAAPRKTLWAPKMLLGSP